MNAKINIFLFTKIMSCMLLFIHDMVWASFWPLQICSEEKTYFWLIIDGATIYLHRERNSEKITFKVQKITSNGIIYWFSGDY
jgi:hypothetical protein